MRKTKLIFPDYADKFRCIGSACEDSCCIGWKVSIDQGTYQKYQSIPAGPLRILIDENVQRTPDNVDVDGQKPHPFASIRMSRSGECPMHNAEKLCQIQVEHGPDYLSQTCSTFPRNLHIIDNFKETTLTLSCPEAARLVLTNRHLTTSSSHKNSYMIWDEKPKTPLPLLAHFWPIREFAVSLLRNRDYLLWQRMFLLGSFCRRLEAVARNEVPGGFSEFERGFSDAVNTGSLRALIETIPANNALQLDMVMLLAGSPVILGAASPRLAGCLEAFLDGIGRGHAITFEEQSTEYATAYERFYAPFFLKHPHMLENLLVNMILQNKFPLGPQFIDPEAPLEPAHQYARMAIEFALIKGLLIGVAGCHREAFSVDHVVQTVQLVVKHFEHNSQFLTNSLELLASKGLDNAQGLTMLLRN